MISKIPPLPPLELGLKKTNNGSKTCDKNQEN